MANQTNEKQGQLRNPLKRCPKCGSMPGACICEGGTEPWETTAKYGRADLALHPLVRETYKVACLIERCGASPELTAASSAAFDHFCDHERQRCIAENFAAYIVGEHPGIARDDDHNVSDFMLEFGGRTVREEPEVIPSNRETLCACCGMSCTPNEYHPYAACLMFQQCHNSSTVRANLHAVVLHGRDSGGETRCEPDPCSACLDAHGQIPSYLGIPDGDIADRVSDLVERFEQLMEERDELKETLAHLARGGVTGETSVTLPEYTHEIGDAGHEYLRSTVGQGPTIWLPGTFRWHELWEAMCRASVKTPPATGWDANGSET